MDVFSEFPMGFQARRSLPCERGERKELAAKMLLAPPSLQDNLWTLSFIRLCDCDVTVTE